MCAASDFSHIENATIGFEKASPSVYGLEFENVQHSTGGKTFLHSGLYRIAALAIFLFTNDVIDKKVQKILRTLKRDVEENCGERKLHHTGTSAYSRWAPKVHG